MATKITRIAAEDVIRVDIDDFFAFRADCIPWGELDDIAREASLAWLKSASEAERKTDPTGQAASKRVWDGYIPGARTIDLYAPIDSLLQRAVRDSRMKGGWGVSTGSGRVAMRPQYVVELGGRNFYLAPAYPGAYRDA